MREGSSTGKSPASSLTLSSGRTGLYTCNSHGESWCKAHPHSCTGSLERLVCLTDRGHPTSTLTVTLEQMAFELHVLILKLTAKRSLKKSL